MQCPYRAGHINTETLSQSTALWLEDALKSYVGPLTSTHKSASYNNGKKSFY